jgi:hypothetical protein
VCGNRVYEIAGQIEIGTQPLIGSRIPIWFSAYEGFVLGNGLVE